MSKRKTRSKKARPKSNALGKEILAALAEFTDALKKGDVAAHLRQRQAEFGTAAANHKPATQKRLRTPPNKNGKKKTRV
jgi:hypothetical protein